MSNSSILDGLIDKDEQLTPEEQRQVLLDDINDYQVEVADVNAGVEKITSQNPNGITQDDTFTELTDLSTRATAVLDACKADIENSTLLDAELIASYSSLIKATHDILKEYIHLYRDRQNFINKVELENVKQGHRKELLTMKNNLTNTALNETIDSKVFVQEAVIKMFNDRERVDG